MMKTFVTLCSLLSLLFSAHADVVQRFEVSCPICSSFKSFRNIAFLHVHVSTVHCGIFLFQDEPECLKYFYKEKVPAWGASTPGAARLCQRFLNR